MLRHIALFRWTDATVDDDIATVEQHLGELPGTIAEIREYHFGRNAGINAGTYDFGVVADFDTADGYLAYRDHPAHQAVFTERIQPHLDSRATIQFEW